jgi:hypothetical protein
MYRLRKDIIPVVLQPGYSPDGWLGILVGTRLYFDLSSPATFDREVTRLIAEIGDRGRIVDTFQRSLSSSSSSSTPALKSVSESPICPDFVSGDFLNGTSWCCDAGFFNLLSSFLLFNCGSLSKFCRRYVFDKVHYTVY